MASERIINEYDSTRIANAVDTLATNLADYSGTTVTPTDAMKAKLPSQTTADRIADALTDIADVAVNGTAYGTSNSAKSTVAKSVTTAKGNFNLVTGSKVLVKFAHGSDSSNLTLNVDSTGAKPVYMNGSALEEELEENGTYQFVYNGTQFDLVGGAGGSSGPQTAIIALSATTASVDNATSTATITMTTNSDGTPSVSSSDSSIATASISNNVITITGVDSGTAIITVSIPATSSYTAAEATITVTSDVFEIVIGDTYFFGGFYWTAAEDLGNKAVCLQSQGMTAGTWPAYKLTTDYTGTKSYGNANTAYTSNIDGDNIANYDEVTQAWYTKYSSTEKTGQAYGSGLFLVSNAKCNQTTSLQQGSGNYWEGLKKAATNYRTFGATYNYAWLSTAVNIGAWAVISDGRLDSNNAQTLSEVIAPAFNIDLTKVKLDGSTIMLLSESKPAMVSFASATPAQREAIVRAYEAGIIDITEYWSDGEEATATLPAIAASGTGWTVGESHAAQDVTLVLSLDNCKELVTVEDNGQKCTKFLYHQKNGLEELGYMSSNGLGVWDSSERRAWCNTAYKVAMIEAFGDIFHQLKNVGAQSSNGSTNQTSNDFFAIAACKEVYGGSASAAGADTYWGNLAEFNALTQMEYYKTSSNRIKKQGNNGSAIKWSERTPDYRNYGFCLVQENGIAGGGDNEAYYARAIVPFGGV